LLSSLLMTPRPLTINKLQYTLPPPHPSRGWCANRLMREVRIVRQSTSSTMRERRVIRACGLCTVQEAARGERTDGATLTSSLLSLYERRRLDDRRRRLVRATKESCCRCYAEEEDEEDKLASRRCQATASLTLITAADAMRQISVSARQHHADLLAAPYWRIVLYTNSLTEWLFVQPY